MLAYQFIKGDSLKDIFIHRPISYAVVTFGWAGYMICILYGFSNAPSFEVNVLNYAWPFLLVLFTHFLSSEKFSIENLIGISMGFGGVLILFYNMGGDAFFSFENTFALAVAFMGAIVWALYSTLTKKVNFKSNGMAVFLIIASLPCLLFHIAFEDGVNLTLNDSLLLLIIAFTRISLVFWDYAMKHGDVRLLSSFAYFVPVASISFFMLFGLTPLNSFIYISAFLVLLGTLISNSMQIIKIFNR